MLSILCVDPLVHVPDTVEARSDVGVLEAGDQRAVLHPLDQGRQPVPVDPPLLQERAEAYAPRCSFASNDPVDECLHEDD